MMLLCFVTVALVEMRADLVVFFPSSVPSYVVHVDHIGYSLMDCSYAPASVVRRT